MEWSKLSERFGSWSSRIKPFYDKGGFDPIYKTLIAKSKSGIQIAPSGINTYRAFKETNFNDLKAVIVTQDPYFKFINDQPIATGVAMDCSLSARAQPTLKQFYNGIEKELYDGLELNFIQRYDLGYLCEQGILLLNTALTVEKDKPGSHMDIWEDFTIFLLKEVIGPTGVPVLFLGKEAAKFEPTIMMTNPTHTALHPASAAYTGGCWNPDGAFVWLNEHIWKSNNETIMWLPIELPF
jgi:uracil-DNA glycosylase